MARNVTDRGHGIGWKRQQLDNRDHVYSAPAHVADTLPSYVDLRTQMPPVYDQGQVGSCTANAVACLLQYERKRQGLPEAGHVPSRLMLYYGARQLEYTTASDAGAEIRDVIKFVARFGSCFEDGPNAWPYVESHVLKRPPAACYQHAYKDKGVSYKSVPQSAQQIMASLAEGWPVAFGFNCYPEIDDDEMASNNRNDPLSGRLPMPRQGEADIGGHAVVIAGYDNANRTFLIRNSWGSAWGLRGYFMMPFEYVLRSDLASDFWQVRLSTQ